MRASLLIIAFTAFFSVALSSQNSVYGNSLFSAISGKEWVPSKPNNPSAKIVFYTDSAYSCVWDVSDSVSGKWKVNGNTVEILLKYGDKKKNVSFEVVFISDYAMTISHNGSEYAYVRDEKQK